MRPACPLAPQPQPPSLQGSALVPFSPEASRRSAKSDVVFLTQHDYQRTSPRDLAHSSWQRHSMCWMPPSAVPPENQRLVKTNAFSFEPTSSTRPWRSATLTAKASSGDLCAAARPGVSQVNTEYGPARARRAMPTCGLNQGREGGLAGQTEWRGYNHGTGTLPPTIGRAWAWIEATILLQKDQRGSRGQRQQLPRTTGTSTTFELAALTVAIETVVKR